MLLRGNEIGILLTSHRLGKVLVGDEVWGLWERFCEVATLPTSILSFAELAISSQSAPLSRITRTGSTSNVNPSVQESSGKRKSSSEFQENSAAGKRVHQG